MCPDLAHLKETNVLSVPSRLQAVSRIHLTSYTHLVTLLRAFELRNEQAQLQTLIKRLFLKLPINYWLLIRLKLAYTTLTRLVPVAGLHESTSDLYIPPSSVTEQITARYLPHAADLSSTFRFLGGNELSSQTLIRVFSPGGNFRLIEI